MQAEVDGRGIVIAHRKIYQVLSDREAALDGDLRVIDESGEDYLFPASSFVPIEVPEAVQRSLLETS